MTTVIPLFTRPFYFVRHGETETNAAGLVSGSLDVDLTARGRQQALRAAEALAHEPITGAYTSPLRRARDTAEPIVERLRVPVHVVGGLAERSWGALEGRPRGARLPAATPEGAETPGEFAKRVLTALAVIDDPVALIVAHSGIFRVLCGTLEIVDVQMPISNATPVRFVPLARSAWRLEPL